MRHEPQGNYHLGPHSHACSRKHTPVSMCAFWAKYFSINEHYIELLGREALGMIMLIMKNT